MVEKHQFKNKRTILKAVLILWSIIMVSTSVQCKNKKSFLEKFKAKIIEQIQGNPYRLLEKFKEQVEKEIQKDPTHQYVVMIKDKKENNVLTIEELRDLVEMGKVSIGTMYVVAYVHSVN